MDKASLVEVSSVDESILGVEGCNSRFEFELARVLSSFGQVLTVVVSFASLELFVVERSDFVASVEVLSESGSASFVDLTEVLPVELSSELWELWIFSAVLAVEL